MMVNQRTFKSDMVAVGDFLRDLGSATVAIPGEMRQWWKDGHTRTEWLYVWEKRNLGPEDGPPSFFSCDNEAERSYADYRLWRTLGVASDALLVTIAVLIVLAIVLAIL
jgi:hypothetical protein